MTPYRAGRDGELEPEIPSEGVCAGQDARACKLSVDHRRERCTGPCFPLTVMRCRSHGRGFTLYPPGHVPYGRVGLLAVAPDGSRARDDDRMERFEGTFFAASLDAAKGRAWHREHTGGSERWWGTQLRRITRAAQLLGLSPGIPSRRCELVAGVLGLDNLLLLVSVKQFRAARGYRERGAAIRRVLEALPQSHLLPERLTECGTIAGRWGEGLRWLSGSATLVRQPFRAFGTRCSPRPP